MFEHPFDFAYKRSVVQAVGFYLFYFVALVLLAIAVGFLMVFGGVSVPEDSPNLINQLTAIIPIVILSFLLLARKKLTKDAVAIVLVVLAVAVSYYFSSGVLGLVFLAYLTTRESKR